MSLDSRGNCQVIAELSYRIEQQLLVEWNELWGMTVVALYSVMMAGPEYFLPGWRSSRE